MQSDEECRQHRDVPLKDVEVGGENGEFNGNGDCESFMTRLVSLFNLFLNLFGNRGLTNVPKLCVTKGMLKLKINLVWCRKGRKNKSKVIQ